MKTLLIILISFALSFTLSAQDAKKCKALFAEFGCNECHTITSQKIGKMEVAKEDADDWDDDEDEGEIIEPPDLSGTGLNHTAKWMSKYLRKKEYFNERLHSKRFQGTKEERIALVLWLETLKDKLK